ncbi:hypothetical protein JAAARDRAFT_131933 [Jaapia argillacea MUCL 33604]|uniref:MICOS complex subunit MIC12 n=1 Tax=Jaapia argillacea MUCL 33604 TaxID=933084 RepID=A0A067PPF4_9AGAM|nr:hypothetical protein JAAARDRAFT_131933 [Jaapia argillacea MUCL 33604]
MSFLTGTLSGALIAGGIYYGFSNLIQTRTKAHQADLHTLSQRLLDPPSSLPAPTPAVQRISHDNFGSYVKDRWNQEIEGMVRTSGGWISRAQEWSKKGLYGVPTRKDEL